MLDKLNLNPFYYIKENYSNSNQSIYIYELDGDNWIEIINTNDSMSESKVVQCYKRCELVDTRVLSLSYSLYDIDKFETDINNIIKEIYNY